MTTKDFPYKRAYIDYLTNKRHLEKISIETSTKTIDDFFQYTEKFNPAYQDDPRVETIVENDVKTYLSMIDNNRDLEDTTYNKYVSNLNQYFEFLFGYKLKKDLPTFKIRRKKIIRNPHLSDKWLQDLDKILVNPNIHIYTKMILLLTSYGFSYKSFLSPGFYRVYNNINFKEKSFVDSFNGYIAPLQTMHESKDLFLKQNIVLDQSPNLSIHYLYKYLRADSNKLGYSLNFGDLYASYVLSFIKVHPKFSSAELQEHLKLDPKTLEYYQSLLKKEEGNEIKGVLIHND